MNTLDKWEEAQHNCGHLDRDIDSYRILALIDLARKKDEALKALKLALENDDPDDELGYIAVVKEALALTEQLK